MKAEDLRPGDILIDLYFKHTVKVISNDLNSAYNDYCLRIEHNKETRYHFYLPGATLENCRLKLILKNMKAREEDVKI